MGIASYADYLRAEGKPVWFMAGVHWMVYNQALIPADAMPVFPDVVDEEAEQIIKKSATYFLRYTRQPTRGATKWWNVVCRHYDIRAVSANTRSKIHRGLKRLQIRQINPGWLAQHGYSCHRACYQRYNNARPMSEASYQRFVSSLQGKSIFDVWGSFHDEDLLGYIVCLHESNGVFMHTIDITPRGLHDYAAYALMHTLLEHYVNTQGIPVSNGSRAIAHDTQMQTFLLNFQFAREYAELHVVYRPDIRFIIKVLYPVRRWLRLFSRSEIFNKINAVLFQEELRRTQYEVDQ